MKRTIIYILLYAGFIQSCKISDSTKPCFVIEQDTDNWQNDTIGINSYRYLRAQKYKVTQDFIGYDFNCIIKNLGNPNEIHQIGTFEYLYYFIKRENNQGVISIFVVKLLNGRVSDLTLMKPDG